MNKFGLTVFSVSIILFAFVLNFTPVNAADYRNAYMIMWDGTACDNVAYAKSMGYDYVGYQYGMENCPGDIDLYFYLESPDQRLNLISNFIYFDKTYTDAQKKEYNDFLLWKSTASFPYNLATGWFFSSNHFRPLADFQQQRVIDSVISTSLSSVKNIENTDKGFLFGGYSWDVPSLEGDLWSGLQSNGGKQVDISYWTKTCSGVKHPGLTQEYACYRDGKAAFYKTLFSETKKTYPNMKVLLEPYSPWDGYISEISKRADISQLKPDIVCEEDDTLQFVTDSRLFSSGLMTKDKMCSSTPNVYDHQGNLVIAGNAGINGAWFLWFGRLGGTGNFPAHDSIKQIPDRLKLIRVVPGWDNLNGVALSSRKWDSSKLEYTSTLSIANMNVIQSIHPKNKNMYAVVLNRATGVNLQGRTLDKIYSVDEFFRQKADATADFTLTNGMLYLKSDTNIGKGYIITFKTSTTPTTPITPSCVDSDGGNVGSVRGSAVGVWSSGVAFDYNDYCVSSGLVKEYYCDGVVAKSVNVSCVGGCKDGACLPAPVINSSQNNTNTSIPVEEPVVPSKPKSSGGGGGGGSASFCGDNKCSSKENCSSCEADCGACVITLYCGDGICTEGNEDVSSCSVDCSLDSESSFSSFDSSGNEIIFEPPTLIGSVDENKVEVQKEVTGFVVKEDIKENKRSGISYLIAVLMVVSATVVFLYNKNKSDGDEYNSNIRSFEDLQKLYPGHAKDILSYVKKAKIQGYSENMIRENLSNVGWPDFVIDSALIQEEN